MEPPDTGAPVSGVLPGRFAGWSVTGIDAGLWLSLTGRQVPADVAGLAAEPDRVSLVIDAPVPDRRTDELIAHLFPWLAAAGPGGRNVRLVLAAGADRYAQAGRAAGLDLIAAEAAVAITPYGYAVVRSAGPGPGGRLAQWRRILPSGDQLPAGTMAPSPAWEHRLGAGPAATPGQPLSVRRVLAGLGLQPEPPVPGQRAEAVWPDPERITVVIGADVDRQAGCDSLAALLPLLPLGATDGVRLYWPRAGSGPVAEALQELSANWGTDLIVPAADVSVSGYGGMSHGPTGAAPWLRFTSDGDVQVEGALYPVPRWEDSLADADLTDLPGTLGVEHIAAGLCVYRHGPSDRGLVATGRSILPDPAALTLVVGGDARDSDVRDNLETVLSLLPDGAVRRIRLLLAGAGAGGPDAYAQYLADTFDIGVTAAVGRWTATPDGRIKPMPTAGQPAPTTPAGAWPRFSPRQSRRLTSDAEGTMAGGSLAGFAVLPAGAAGHIAGTGVPGPAAAPGRPVSAGPARPGPVPAGSVSAGLARPGPVPAGSVSAGPARPGPVPAGSVPAGLARPGSVPAGSVPPGSAPADSVPAPAGPGPVVSTPAASGSAVPRPGVPGAGVPGADVAGSGGAGSGVPGPGDRVGPGSADPASPGRRGPDSAPDAPSSARPPSGASSPPSMPPAGSVPPGAEPPAVSRPPSVPPAGSWPPASDRPAASGPAGSARPPVPPHASVLPSQPPGSAPPPSAPPGPGWGPTDRPGSPDQRAPAYHAAPPDWPDAPARSASPSASWDEPANRPGPAGPGQPGGAASPPAPPEPGRLVPPPGAAVPPDSTWPPAGGQSAGSDTGWDEPAGPTQPPGAGQPPPGWPQVPPGTAGPAGAGVPPGSSRPPGGPADADTGWDEPTRAIRPRGQDHPSGPGQPPEPSGPQSAGPQAPAGVPAPGVGAPPSDTPPSGTVPPDTAPSDTPPGPSAVPPGAGQPPAPAVPPAAGPPNGKPVSVLFNRDHRSTVRERLRYRESAARYQSYLVSVRRMLTQRPGLRAAAVGDGEDAVITDFAAVLDLLGDNQREIAITLRTSTGGMDSRVPCVISGLRRLPSFTGVVFTAASAPAAMAAGYVVGAMLIEPSFVYSSSSRMVALDGNLEYVIWSETGKRAAAVAADLSRDEIVFAAGTPYKVLQIDTSRPGDHVRVFLREAPRTGRGGAEDGDPGQTLDDMDLRVLERLRTGASLRDDVAAEDRVAARLAGSTGQPIGLDPRGIPYRDGTTSS